MTKIDSYRLTKAQNTIAESVRVEARRVANTLGLPRDCATAKLLAEACRNAAQTFQLLADCDMDLALGDADTFTKDAG